MVGRGRKQLTPDLLLDFSALPDVPTADLAALTGITLADEVSVQRPAVTGVAELIWDVRRLTADQVKHVTSIAEAMRGGQYA
jgi:hypothetical protein